MNYEISFNNQKYENFFCTLFDKEKIFSLVQYILEGFPGATVAVINPVKPGKYNYIKPKIDIFAKGTELFLPFSCLNIKSAYSEDDWNPYPSILPPYDSSNPLSEWLVQKTDGTLEIAYYYNSHEDVGDLYTVVNTGWKSSKTAETYIVDNIVAFRKLPEKYLGKQYVDN